MKNLIEVSHVSKSYGKVQALRNVSFSVKQGELFGLIGPDGAGKSTLFRILTTLLLPDQGSARVLDADVRADFRTIRQSVGYMPGRFSLYQDLTVEENYERIRAIYEQIAPFKQRRAGALSGGIKQKLALCCALVHAPKVLFLDEPTTGVDPVSRREFWEMLAYLRQEGITLVVSTPFMDEALRCDRVAFLYEGEIKGIDRPEAILKQFSEILCPPGLQRKAVDKHTPPIIQVDNLVKRFGSFTAVDHISFLYNGEKFSALPSRLVTRRNRTAVPAQPHRTGRSFSFRPASPAFRFGRDTDFSRCHRPEPGRHTEYVCTDNSKASHTNHPSSYNHPSLFTSG